MTIQEAGTQILGDKPTKFYIFTGAEYGIKRKYIEHLKQFYGTYATVETVEEVLSIMSKKRLIPLKPKLYLVRYDETFITSINDKTAASIEKTKIIGTVVCLYELPKSAAKCEKYLSDYTVAFDGINPEFIKKYLRTDFPQLTENMISAAVQIHRDYMGAYNVCLSLSHLPEQDQQTLTFKEVSNAVGYTQQAEDTQIRHAFAARDIRACFELIDCYSGDISNIFYIWLSTILELEKLITNSKQRSDLGKYVNSWNVNSIYNMFMQVFDELERSRSLSYYDTYNGLCYVIELLAIGGR